MFRVPGRTGLEGHSVTSFHGRVTCGERCQCGLGVVGTVVSSPGGEKEVCSPPGPGIWGPSRPPSPLPSWHPLGTVEPSPGSVPSPQVSSLPRALAVGTGDTKIGVSEPHVGRSSGR